MDAKMPGSVSRWVVALALTLLAAPAEAQQVTAGPLDVDLTGRVQVQLNTTSVDEEDVTTAPASSAFETRRVRFGAELAYGEWITGKVEADFAGGGARLTDGYIDLGLSDRLGLRAGQFKKPFGVFELESSTRIRTIERGVRIRGLSELVGVPAETQYLLAESGYLGRQIGAMLHGGVAGVEYAVGIFNGEGANTKETAGTKAYAGRLTYDLGDVAGGRPVVIGAGLSVQPTGLFDGSDEVHGKAVELDASWGGFREPGLHARAEWMLGDDPLVGENPLVRSDLPTMTGVHGLVSWFAPRQGRVEGWEPVLRLSWADPATDIDGDSGVLLTPGFNVYFNGRNRFMVNGDVYVPERDDLDPELALVAQLQLYF